MKQVILATAVCLICFQTTVAADKKASTYLQAAVRVNEKNASCGTIIKAEKDCVWIISTGHMWKRNEPLVEAFYAKGAKLPSPVKAKGKMLLRVENNLDYGVDFCLIQVSFGDFDHTCFASVKFGTPKVGNKCVSIGCDMGIKPTEFQMEIIEIRKDRGDIYTKAEQSTNGGRSGGGLFYDGKMVAISWGATLSQPEKGLYTNSQSIIKVLKACGYDKLTEEKK